jgi:hypothetical protein
LTDFRSKSFVALQHAGFPLVEGNAGAGLDHPLEVLPFDFEEHRGVARGLAIGPHPQLEPVGGLPLLGLVQRHRGRVQLEGVDEIVPPGGAAVLVHGAIRADEVLDGFDQVAGDDVFASKRSSSVEKSATSVS